MECGGHVIWHWCMSYSITFEGLPRVSPVSLLLKNLKNDGLNPGYAPAHQVALIFISGLTATESIRVVWLQISPHEGLLPGAVSSRNLTRHAPSINLLLSQR